MYHLQPSSRLLCLALEIRLAIYSYVALPPFDGHQEYAGLLFSCRQLKDEIQRESRLRLNSYLDKVEQRAAEELRSQHPIETCADEVALGSIHIARPDNPLASPELAVTVPFFLPDVQHNWHHFYYQAFVLPGHSVPHYIGQDEHMQQQRVYGERVNDTLRPLEDLVMLHFSCIIIHITLPDEVSEQIHGDKHQVPPIIQARDEGKSLKSVPLGRLLDTWVACISRQMRTAIKDWWDHDVPFHATKATISWDFTSEQAPKVPSVCYTREISQYDPFRGLRVLTKSTNDCMEGIARLSFDKEEYLRFQKTRHIAHLARWRKHPDRSFPNPDVKAFFQRYFEGFTKELAKIEDRMKQLGIADLNEDHETKADVGEPFLRKLQSADCSDTLH